LTFNLGKQAIPIPIDWKRLGRLLLVSGVIIPGVLMIDNLATTLWMKVVLKGFGVSLFPIALLLVGFISHAQSREILQLGKKIISKKLRAP